jgi:flagellin
MRELAVQGSNDTLDDTDREFINVEMKELRAQINSVSTSTEFNGKKLANGNLESTLVAAGSTTELGMATANASVVGIDVSNAAGNTTFTFTDTGTGLQLATGGVIQEISDADMTIGVDGQQTITWATHGVSLTFASALGDDGSDIAAALTTKTIVTGATNASATFHTGADKGQVMVVDFKNVEINTGAGDARMQQVDTGLQAFEGGTATRAEAEDLIEDLDAAIEYISETRAGYGAAQNRLESAVNNLMQTSENLTASESRIRDVDVAAESAEMARATVLQQAAVSVLAQANQQPQLALKLLG